MKELLDRFIALEQTLTEEEGEFALFALFLREDAEGGISGYSGYSAKWDLVVAAPWIERDRIDPIVMAGISPLQFVVGEIIFAHELI